MTESEPAAGGPITPESRPIERNVRLLRCHLVPTQNIGDSVHTHARCIHGDPLVSQMVEVGLQGLFLRLELCNFTLGSPVLKRQGREGVPWLVRGKMGKFATWTSAHK
jgi:hypothetical protein